jgi:ABC-type Fe3+-hydroxamate transport system substrate-binding protein
MNRKLLRIVLFILVVMLAVALSGCRKSDVLTQIIYDQTAEVVDKDTDTKIIENTQSDVTDINLPAKTPNPDSKPKDTIKAPGTENKNAPETQQPAPKTVPTKPKSDKDSDAIPEPDNQTDDEDTGENDQGGPDSDGSSEDPNSREIEDENGDTVTLPETVNKVVAAGDAAIIVQMLGGKDILAATSSDVLSNSLASSAFSAEGIGKAQKYWDGDGTTQMSAANFTKLLTMKPDVCVTVSGSGSFSDSQIAKLKEKKIAIVTLPKMNTYSNIVRAVKVTGNLIGDRSSESGGINAKELAAEYEDYSKDLLAKVQKKSGGRFTWDSTDYNNDIAINGTKKYSGQTTSNGKYTLYISGWDASATFQMKSKSSTFVSEKGVAIAPRGYSNSPLSYYMSEAGVLNNGARFTSDSTKNKLAAIPFNLNIGEVSISGNSPPSLYSNKNENFLRAWNGSAIDIALGQSDFPAIIVDSSATKQKIENSDIVWKSYGKNTVDGMTDYGFIASNESGERLVISYIRGDYNIYVNPYGLTDWTGGSPESVLESIWASWKITEKSSENEVRSEIKAFYKKFYRYAISDSEINRILAGK